MSRFDKLPKWAKDHIAHQDAKIMGLERELDAQQNGQWTVVGTDKRMTIGDRYEGKRLVCGPYQSVRVDLDGGHFIDARPEDITGEIGIAIYGNLGMEELVIKPQSSNTCFITAAPRRKA